MTKWEYQVQRLQVSSPKIAEKIEDKLDIQGNQGWELVQTLLLTKGQNQFLFAIYKRPIDE